MFTFINCFALIWLGGIPKFEAVEHESRITTHSKMKDYHMQWFLVREQLFVNQGVTNFDVVKLVSHGDIEGLSAQHNQQCQGGAPLPSVVKVHNKWLQL